MNEPEESEDFLIGPPVNETIKAQLVLKLEEYRERRRGPGKDWEFMPPELAHGKYVHYRDACYKIHVLEAVLESDWPVDANQLFRDMYAKWGQDFKSEDFLVACNVVDTYCKGLPIEAFLSKGTGLPKLPANQ